jgi:hypothetical protein
MARSTEPPGSKSASVMVGTGAPQNTLSAPPRFTTPSASLVVTRWMRGSGASSSAARIARASCFDSEAWPVARTMQSGHWQMSRWCKRLARSFSGAARLVGAVASQRPARAPRIDVGEPPDCIRLRPTSARAPRRAKHRRGSTQLLMAARESGKCTHLKKVSALRAVQFRTCSSVVAASRFRASDASRGQPR